MRKIRILLLFVVLLTTALLLTSCKEEKYRLTLESGTEKIVSCVIPSSVNHYYWMEFRCDGDSYRVIAVEKVDE